MAPRKKISTDVRNLVVKYEIEKKCLGKILKLLNLPKSMVQTIFDNVKRTKSVENKPRSGRPKNLSRRDISFILKEVGKNPKVHATKIAEEPVMRSGRIVYPRTVQRVLTDEGFHRRTWRKKNLISGGSLMVRGAVAASGVGIRCLLREICIVINIRTNRNKI